jgi:hypothetical protein
MGPLMKGSFIQMKSMEKGFIAGRIINLMMDNGDTIKCMGRAQSNGLMVMF